MNEKYGKYDKNNPYSNCYSGSDSSVKACLKGIFADRVTKEEAQKVEIKKLRALYDKVKDGYGGYMSGFKSQLYKQQEESGSYPSDAKAFEFFVKKMRQMQKTMIRLGEDLPVKLSPFGGEHETIFFSDNMQALLGAYAEGGDGAYHKKFNEIMKKMNKKLNLVIKCKADSDCEDGICEKTSGACVGCLTDDDCQSGYACYTKEYRCVQKKEEKKDDKECTKASDCPSGHSCDISSNTCYRDYASDEIEYWNENDFYTDDDSTTAEDWDEFMDYAGKFCDTHADCPNGYCDSFGTCAEGIGEDWDCDSGYAGYGGCVECMYDSDCEEKYGTASYTCWDDGKCHPP